VEYVHFRLHVLFKPGKAVFKDEKEAGKVAAVSEFMNGHAGTVGVIDLEGHPDPGKIDLALAKRRATAVRDRMLQLGVDPSKMTISVFKPTKGAPRHLHVVGEVEAERVGGEAKIQGDRCDAWRERGCK